MDETGAAPVEPVEAFIARWQGREGGQERANYALFLVELCELLGLPRPDPADATHEHNDYVFERAVTKRGDGGDTLGRIDLYRRGSFVLEAKQSRLAGGRKEIVDLFGSSEQKQLGRRGASRSWDVLMMNAKRQAEEYARALPVSHGWPPFILVCDVGHSIEVYADFSGQGKNYTQFPDRQGFRIFLEDLRRPDVQERLRAIWLDPTSLDPARKNARVTREIAERLAAVSRALEKGDHPPEEVAMFLMRALFTMFAEDVDLLPHGSFRELLETCEKDPASFEPMVGQLWEAMDQGEFAYALRTKVKRFNGEFFKAHGVPPVGREEIGELRQAASHNWRDVEPAIFGTLLEQALNPRERRRLGAYYTPRAYVERLVVSTIMEPLREDWEQVLLTAERQKSDGRPEDALETVRAFHDRLCKTRVLDPACGTGNFLYVAMELVKRLEGEVLEALADLGGQEALTGLEGHTVDPHQFLGMEINPRAAAIAELVLWIGYLQWHFRTKGSAPSEPILRAFKNIKVCDAVLTWDGYPEVVEGRYSRPRRPTWPTAEFIVGNPPFMGGKDIRSRMPEGYAEALWAAHPHMNESADFVMYWWDRAAELLVAKGTLVRRFGFVTTNSITQEFSGRVIRKRLEAKDSISLIHAIPDHPWTKATRDAAAVRIAMTVAARGKYDGVLREVVSEQGLNSEQPAISFVARAGQINPDLTVGANVKSALPLKANEGMCSPGMKLHGSGFIVTPQEANLLGLGKREGIERHLNYYMNGRDITGISRGLMLIDCFGLSENDLMSKFPEIYQHLTITVKPERQSNNRASYRDNWWIFGEPRSELRPALLGLCRYIVTVETSQHRIFKFLDESVMPDNRLICFPSDDGYILGCLSSRIHVIWSLFTGGTLEDRPIYTKSRCFDPFPFPDGNPEQDGEIRSIAEELNAFREARQTEHRGLTLTGIYNVLEKIRAGVSPSSLDDVDHEIFEHGLVLVLKELHDRLDAAVAAAYGWPVDLGDEEIVARLVALNKQRAAEERRGIVSWIRPEYQIPRFGSKAEKDKQFEADLVMAAVKEQKPSFPAEEVAQTAAVMSVLARTHDPLDAGSIALTFRQGKRIEPKVASVLTALSRMGFIVKRERGWQVHRAREMAPA